MATFMLEIVTPQRIAFTESVEAVYAPTPAGRVGILPRHMALFTSLSEGEVKIKTPTREYFLAIGGGFMEVTRDKVSILVSRAVHADEVNVSEIEKARHAAQEAISRRVKGEELANAQAILRRSLIELRVARRHRRYTPPTLEV